NGLLRSPTCVTELRYCLVECRELLSEHTFSILDENPHTAAVESHIGPGLASQFGISGSFSSHSDFQSFWSVAIVWLSKLLDYVAACLPRCICLQCFDFPLFVGDRLIFRKYDGVGANAARKTERYSITPPTYSDDVQPYIIRTVQTFCPL